MNIIICGRQGSGKKTVSKSLIDFFMYRGTAAIHIDHLHTIENAHDAVWMILDQNFLPKIGGDDYQCPLLCASLYEWLGGLAWAGSTKRRIKYLTDFWDKENVHYAAIISSLTSPQEIKVYFDDSFKVYLTCSETTREARICKENLRSESNIIESGFNDCAVSDIFDMVIDTNELKPDEVAALIGNKFQDKLKNLFTKSV